MAKDTWAFYKPSVASTPYGLVISGIYVNCSLSSWSSPNTFLVEPAYLLSAIAKHDWVVIVRGLNLPQTSKTLFQVGFFLLLIYSQNIHSVSLESYGRSETWGQARHLLTDSLPQPGRSLWSDSQCWRSSPNRRPWWTPWWTDSCRYRSCPGTRALPWKSGRKCWVYCNPYLPM